MNVICIGYFDKFSRYFLDIKKHLKANLNTTLQFKIYSIYLSGFLYAFIRFQYSSWLPLKAWLLVLKKRTFYSSKIDTSTEYKGINYASCITFHTSLSNHISSTSLKLQALAYIDIFDALFNTKCPDVLLCIGDSRMPFEIAIALAKQKNISIYYLEQGPFNTTFFDDQGVNANLSIRDTFNCDTQYNSADEKNEFKVLEKYNRFLFYRGFDMLFKTLFESTRLYPPDIKKTDLNSFNKPKRHIVNANVLELKNTVLVILQVPLDVNMIYHSPYFKNHYEMIKAVFTNLPVDHQIIVREHPLYINKYDTKMYRYIEENKINIDNTTELKQAITTSSLVVVNNSTVGLEGLFYHKPILVLGDAFYDSNGISYKYRDTEDLGVLMKLAINSKLDSECIERYKRFLYHTVLLQGSMSEKHLRSSKIVAMRLLEAHPKLNT